MSETNQTSFGGGMNLTVDDTRIAPNEYREAFNVRNRFDVLDSVINSVELSAPSGGKQGLYTFGDYFLLFVSGNAYYQHRLLTGWTRIDGFNLSPIVPKYFLETVPVSTTLYARKLPTSQSSNDPMLQTNALVSGGTPSGVVVQDGLNQPQFIFIDTNGIVKCRTTQKKEEWFYDPTDADDHREYVPIGTLMVFYSGVLHVLAPDGFTILRSVSGRPLDFGINIDIAGNLGGDAYTTAYTVGVGPITAMRLASGDGIFISAANRFCYNIAFNRTPNAPTEFGEYTYIRQFLFEAGVVNERSIIDVLGDTVFIDREGLRSYNAIVQLQNEGRNSIFSKKVSPLFNGILQDSAKCSAIVFDNYALFSVNTIYGQKILVYDTLTQSFTGMDDQTNGVGVKQFAKIDTTDVVQLYAITNDDRILRLYGGTGFATSSVRIGSSCSQNPKVELQVGELRCVLNGFVQNSSVTATAFVNNRVSGSTITKNVLFKTPVSPYVQQPDFADVDTQVNNITFNFTGANQGWKYFFLLKWTGGGSITNIQSTAQELSPTNPPMTESVRPT